MIIIKNKYSKYSLLAADLNTNFSESGKDAIVSEFQFEHKEFKPVFSIRFDDGYSTWYSTWYPFLKAKGITGLMVLTLDRIGVVGGTTWEHLAIMLADGWEIGIHAVDSATDWAAWSYEDIKAEVIQIRDAIRTNLNHDPKILTGHRHSASSPYLREISRELGLIANISPYFYAVSFDNNTAVINPYSISSLVNDLGGSGYTLHDLSTPEGIANTKTVIDGAIANNLWTTFQFHSWSQAYQDGLEEVIDYALLNGMEWMRFDDALDVFNNQLIIGDYFGVDQRGVRIDRVIGEVLWVDELATKLGYEAGRANTNNQNVFVGRLAGSNDGEKRCVRGVFIGENAGRDFTADAQNDAICIGETAGYLANISRAVMIGRRAGMQSTGAHCHFVGYESGYGNTGLRAMGIGYQSCLNNTKSDYVEIKHAISNAVAWIKGFFNTRAFIQGAPATAVADAEIDNSSLHWYLDEATNKLMGRVRYSDGTYGTVELNVTKDV